MQFFSIEDKIDRQLVYLPVRHHEGCSVIEVGISLEVSV
jgi:hypothetical protein